MLQISAELLAMSSDAAVLVKNGKLIFANTAACAFLGSDCVGKSVRELFGEEIAGIQAASFLGNFPIKGRHFIVRACAAEGIKAIFFSPAADSSELISDAFIFSLRNSLMNMNLSLSMLREQLEGQPELQGSLAVVSQGCYRINRVLSNVCIIRGAVDGSMSFSPAGLDLNSFIGDIVKSLQIITGGVEISFKSSCDGTIFADASLIECLVLNLISNCLLHARDCSRISIRLSEGREHVFLSVDDNGCGIAPDTLHTVFDRYRHNFDLSDMNRGPGLGFAAARHIAELHGGTILLESRPGSGTSVRVSLHRDMHRAAALKQPAPEHEASMSTLLTWLSDCLAAEFYTDKYLE